MQEKVLVVPRIDLFQSQDRHTLEAFHGFSDSRLAETLKIIEEKSFFMDRDQAENDPNYKQIIPYVVVLWHEKVFTVKRLRTQGEARLHDKVSLGIGGHINPEDGSPESKPWESGLKRELSEELLIAEPWNAELVGMINDDSVPVGAVHLGLVYQIRLAEGKVMIREMDKMQGSFLPPSEVSQHYDQMETWSQFVFGTFWPDFLFKMA